MNLQCDTPARINNFKKLAGVMSRSYAPKYDGAGWVPASRVSQLATLNETRIQIMSSRIMSMCKGRPLDIRSRHSNSPGTHVESPSEPLWKSLGDSGPGHKAILAAGGDGGKRFLHRQRGTINTPLCRFAHVRTFGFRSSDPSL